MTYADASNYYQALTARENLMDSDRGFLEKTRELANLKKLQDIQPEKPRQWTFGDVMKGVLGAGLAAGFARGAGKLFGVDPGYADKLETAAMGIGAAMNTGVVKWGSDEQERRQAFRIGFLKGAMDSKLFKKEAIMPIPVFTMGLGDLLSIPRSAAKALTGTSRNVGHLAGVADAPDETEEELTKLELERQMLQEQLKSLRSDRRNRALRDVLAKRRGKR